MPFEITAPGSVVPVQDLVEEFKVNRTTPYIWFKHLGIKPQKSGKRAYITQHEYNLTKQFKILLDGDMGVDQAKLALGFEPEPEPESTAIAPVQPAPVINVAINAVPERTLIDALREISEIAREQWIIPTAEVARLTGWAERTIRDKASVHPFSFDQYGYQFYRVDTNNPIGQSHQWGVRRP